jgi:mRNA-degrading endonuclease RelE of RelBE toxin-antitoxin system
MSRTGRDGIGGKKEPSAPLPYTVEMTASAEEVYKDLYRKAKVAADLGHPESVHCTKFRMIQEAVKTIIPRDPINRDFALRGSLSNIFRLRKGRMRIMWIASSERRRVCILFISETLRKEGDANDPYERFKKLYLAGAFNEALTELGVNAVPVRKYLA